ncbi:MAG: MBL fold metallo-hydrolase [Pyrinomonadaceae bacterium]|nr:MBL fold metallo-hydrolase [Pyrinomonadaceae bacterium]
MNYPKRNLSAVYYSVICLAMICLFSAAARAQMKMHVINVGQAEAVLLEFPRHAVLIDAGGEDTFETAVQNRFRRHLLEYLDAFFARRNDLNQTLYSVVVSHPHKDHTKNLRAVFERYTVKHFIEGGGSINASGMDDVRAIRNIVAEKNIAHHRIYARDVKRPSFMRDWSAELLRDSQTEAKFLSAGRRCNDDNNASLVLRVAYQGKSFLFVGDAEIDDKEGRKLGCGGLLSRLLVEEVSFPELVDVDVLKVGHHGSKNGTSKAFLEKVTPQFAVLSAGVPATRSSGRGRFFHAWNFGHPNEIAVKLLEEHTIKTRSTLNVTTMTKPRILIENRPIDKAIYCTCWDGDLVFTVSAAGNLEAPETSN